MILAIDIGNTNIVLGLIEDGKISSVAPRITTDLHKTDYEYAVAMENVLDFVGVDATEAEGPSSPAWCGLSPPSWPAPRRCSPARPPWW